MDYIPLSENEILSQLPPELRRRSITVFDVTDSTNTQAKSAALGGAEHGAVFLAEEQTGGRGRHGKSFFSPAGTGLYMSMVIRPGGASEMDPQLLTVSAAVAVCLALERLAGVQPQIKWVNDLYLNGRKICGILAEAVFSPETGKPDFFVLGIGVNCSTDSFPGELDGIAGSLNMPGLSRNALAAEIIRNIDGGALPTGHELIEEYKRRSMVLGKTVTFLMNGAEHTAAALDIGEDGSLAVSEADGKITYLSSGEVSIRADL